MLKFLLDLEPGQEVESIAFRGGWLLALLLIAAAIAFAIYLYRSESNLPPQRRILMVVCQAAALFCLIVILLQPVAGIRETKDYQRTMLVLLDTSRSMAIADPRTKLDDVAEAAKGVGRIALDRELRGDEVDEVRADLRELSRLDLARGALANEDINLLGKLDEQYEVRLFSFDSQLRSETDLSATSESAPQSDREPGKPTGESSQIGSAIDEAVGRFAGQPVAGVMVMSDFAWVKGKDPVQVARQLKPREIPLYPVPVGLSAPPDIELQGVIAPEVVFKGDRVPLRVKLESRGFDGRRVDLALTIDGQPTTSQAVELKDGVQFEEMMFIPEQESGTLKLEFKISALSGETTDLNNTTSHQVRILDEKIQVLYIEGMPRWEYRYLRWVLLRDPRLNVKFLMTEGDPALARSSPQHIGRFPQDPKEALKYDLVIIGDVPSGYFTAAQMDLMEQLVKEQGGSLLMIAGPTGAPGSYRDTPIENILPVQLGAGGFEAVDPNVSPVVTSAGQESLSTSLSLEPETSARIWSHVKPMYQLPQLGGAKPGATVLLSLPKSSDQIPDYPLVAWHRYGTGKSLFVGTEDLWRMRLEVGDRYHARFWGQTIQFLTLSRLLGQNKQITIETDKGSYSAGDQIRLYANVLTESFEPVLMETYSVELMRAGEPDTRTSIELSKVPGSPGLYSGSQLAGRDGGYVLTTRAQDAEISNRVEFQVATEPLEDRETAMQSEVARQLADLSGGRSLGLAELATFPADLGEEPELTNVVRSERDLWDVPLLFIALVAFAGIEWYLRRKENLV